MTDKRRIFAVLVTTIATVLGGCASTMSGVGGAGKYACKAPVGSQCTSVSGVYANSMQGQPPAAMLSKSAKARTSASPAVTGTATTTAAPVLSLPASALRSQPRVLRLWIAPWEDADGDLHEAAVVHVLVDTGRWLIERVVPSNQNRIDAVRPPAPSIAPASSSSPGEASPDRFPLRRELPSSTGATGEP